MELRVSMCNSEDRRMIAHDAPRHGVSRVFEVAMMQKPVVHATTGHEITSPDLDALVTASKSAIGESRVLVRSVLTFS